MLTDGEETRMTQLFLYFRLPLYKNGVHTERTQPYLWEMKSQIVRK